MLCISSCSLLCSLQPDCLNPCHQAPNLETRERWPPYQKTFFCFDFSQLLFCVSNVFVFIICLCFFIAANKTHSNKQVESNEKKEDITLQNLAGGKYIYGPPNFIYGTQKKRRQMRYNAFLMSYNFCLTTSIFILNKKN